MAIEEKPTLREFEIPWKGEKAKVTIKKLTFGERCDIDEQCIDVKIIGSQDVVKVMHGQMKLIRMLKSLVKAPFNISIDDIRNLDSDVGATISKEIDKLNKISELKKSS